MTKLSPATLADLSKSGLTAKDAKNNLIRDVSAEELLEIYNKAKKALGQSSVKNLNGARGYEIPYFGIDGEPTGFCRYKLLVPFITRDGKAIKYLQLPGTKPHFYMPRSLNWKKLAEDVTEPLYVVEGEKKALAVAKLGLPVIGLGGIWSWRNREDDDSSELISDFNLIDWKGRKTIIAFDADV